MILIFISIAIFSRLLIIYLNKQHFSYGLIEVGDAAGHLIFIRQLKKNFHSKYIERYLIKDDAYISYPFLFHRLASFLPNKIIEKRFIINSILFVFVFTIVNAPYNF